MRIAGSYMVHAARDRVWPLIFDPRVLLQLIPGCEQIELAGPGAYRGVVVLRLPAVSGTYQTCIKILDQEQPGFCRFEGEAAGSGGSVKGRASFTLKDVGQQTIVEYDGDAVIAGALAAINPRFVEGVVQTLIQQGLGRLDARVATAAVEAPPAAPSRGLPGLIRRIVAWVQGWVRRAILSAA